MNIHTNMFIAPDEIKGNNVLSKYYQVYMQLKKEIFFGNYNPGDRFFSLRNLREKYGVDMQTIQMAVALTLKDGLLYKQSTSGLYVNDRKKFNANLFMGNVWFCQSGHEKNHP